jgi:hypothetical protein
MVGWPGRWQFRRLTQGSSFRGRTPGRTDFGYKLVTFDIIAAGKNPYPDKVIKSVTMASTGNAIPVLFGITVADSLAECAVLKKVLE